MVADGARSRRRRPSLRGRRERSIFRATIRELARFDYGGLTFEHVAARAGVNKTTLYRRWPKKADLVRASLTSVAEAYGPGATTGSLRADLVRIGRRMVAFARSSDGRSLMRLRLVGHPEPELAAIARTIETGRQAQLEAMLAAAVGRGELAPDADLTLLLDMLKGALHVNLLFREDRVDDALIGRIADILLCGALAPRHGRRAR